MVKVILCALSTVLASCCMAQVGGPYLGCGKIDKEPTAQICSPSNIGLKLKDLSN
jgi:hypothetical protein